MRLNIFEEFYYYYWFFLFFLKCFFFMNKFINCIFILVVEMIRVFVVKICNILCCFFGVNLLKCEYIIFD